MTSPSPTSLSVWKRSIRTPLSLLPPGPALSIRVLSVILTVVVLTEVVVPFTNKFPLIVALPPTKRSLAIPTPPFTTKAPLPTPVLWVELVTCVTPAMLVFPPTFIFFSTPIPPFNTKDPELILLLS